jgi:hypothetical protein
VRIKYTERGGKERIARERKSERASESDERKKERERAKKTRGRTLITACTAWESREL